jgi:AcrR family transcriptional regulator
MATATPRNRRLPPNERRALIEDAAARLFAERGYAGTRLDDIAAAAHVTKPVLYRHFASKKALHLALLAKHRDELLQQIVEHAAGDEPIEPRLPEILDAWFGYVEDHPYAWRMLFRDTTGDPEIQAFHRELQASARMLTVRLIEAREDVPVPPGEVELRAELVRSAMTGLALWWIDHPEVPRALLVEVMTGVTKAALDPARAG